jgi:hypothetical protein
VRGGDAPAAGANRSRRKFHPAPRLKGSGRGACERGSLITCIAHQRAPVAVVMLRLLRSAAAASADRCMVEAIARLNAFSASGSRLALGRCDALVVAELHPASLGGG